MANITAMITHCHCVKIKKKKRVKMSSAPYVGCQFFPLPPTSVLPLIAHSSFTNNVHSNYPNSYPRARGRRHALYMTKRPSSGFAYECEDCGVATHPLLAGVDIEIKIKHKSHPSHPLMAICKEVSCECDGCGRQQKGFFFCCHLCNFWIHRDCTILPDAIALLDQPDPFFLTFSLSPYQINTGDGMVCREPLFARTSNIGVYFCPRTTTFAHISCGKDERAGSKRRVEPIQLPDDEWDAFPSRAIRRYGESEALGADAYYDVDDIIPNMTDFDAADLKIEKYHNHPLTLAGNGTGTGAKKLRLACDLCTQPIDTSSSSPFHKCHDCKFIAHEICAGILPNIAKFFVVSPDGDAFTTELYRAGHGRPGFFSSVFYCRFCRRRCNGVCSYFPGVQISTYDGDDDGMPLCIDLECMAAPITVYHASHPQHILFRTSSAGGPLSCCGGPTFFSDVYRCIVCSYAVHTSCAMLPRRIHFREYHRPHPLHLIFPPPPPPPPPLDEDEDEDEYLDGVLFCEVCEKGVNLEYWLYRCVECDQWFHVECIPSVGYLSKVKFGGEVSVDPSCHPHPLALTRMLTVPSQRCGSCEEIVDGLVDKMAFFCSLCHFWLHFSCAAPRQPAISGFTSLAPPLVNPSSHRC